MRAGFGIVGLVLLSQAVLAGPFPPTVTLEEVHAHVREGTSGHPRLLATEDELRVLGEVRQADTLKGELARAVITQAEAYLEAPPVTRKLEGRRLLGVSRICVKRVVHLAMAYHLTGEPRFADRCEQEMLAAARFRRLESRAIFWMWQR